MNAQKLNIKRVINASGKMTILGNGTLTDDVMEAMREGAQQYYEMAELVKESGRVIAEKIGTEAAWIINSASAGIALSVAGLITKSVPKAIAVEHLQDVHGEKEIIMMRGHLVDYGAPISSMIHLGGASINEVGYANGCDIAQLEAAITEHTVGIMFVKSHHCVQKNMPTMEAVSEVAAKANLPFILDIAAEESFAPYVDLADLLIMSGSKAIEGPTSGIVAGKKIYIEAMQMHQHGIGRAMKIGKESIFGLLHAFATYEDKQMSEREQKELLHPLYELESLPGIKVTINRDESGRDIFRARITVDEMVAGISAHTLTTKLQRGEIAIYTRDYLANVGSFDLDPRPLKQEEVAIIIATIKQIVGEAS